MVRVQAGWGLGYNSLRDREREREEDKGIKTKWSDGDGDGGGGGSRGTLPAIEQQKSIAGVTERCAPCSQYGPESHLNAFSVEYKLQSTHWLRCQPNKSETYQTGRQTFHKQSVCFHKRGRGQESVACRYFSKATFQAFQTEARIQIEVARILFIRN